MGSLTPIKCMKRHMLDIWLVESSDVNRWMIVFFFLSFNQKYVVTNSMLFTTGKKKKCTLSHS